MDSSEEVADVKDVKYYIIKCVETGKIQYVCMLCHRKLSSKQRIASHLYTNHGQSEYYIFIITIDEINQYR